MKLIGRLPDGQLIVQAKPPGVEVLPAHVWVHRCPRCSEEYVGDHSCFVPKEVKR